MSTIVPDKTPVYNDKTKQLVGRIVNPNNDTNWAVELTKPLPENYIHVQYNPRYEGGKIIGVIQIVFETE